MKKFMNAVIVAFFLLAFCGKSYALTNWGESDLYKQLKETFNNNTTTTTSSGSQIGGLTATGDITFRQSLLTDGRFGANSTVLFSSSTTLQQANIPYALILKAIGNNATAEATVLPVGIPGQEITIRIYAAGGAGSWTIAPDVAAATPVKSTGWTKITFNAVGQNARLLYLNDTLGWIILSTGTSAALASPTVTAPSLN